MLKEDTPDIQAELAENQVPLEQQHSARETDHPLDVEYIIATVANITIPPNQMGLVDIAITDGQGIPAPSEGAYSLNDGIIAQGAVLLGGITPSKGKIAVMNYNNDTLHLQKGIPFATALRATEEDILHICVVQEFSLQKEEVYTLMALLLQVDEHVA